MCKKICGQYLIVLVLGYMFTACDHSEENASMNVGGIAGDMATTAGEAAGEAAVDSAGTIAGEAVGDMVTTGGQSAGDMAGATAGDPVPSEVDAVALAELMTASIQQFNDGLTAYCETCPMYIECDEIVSIPTTIEDEAQCILDRTTDEELDVIVGFLSCLTESAEAGRACMSQIMMCDEEAFSDCRRLFMSGSSECDERSDLPDIPEEC